LVVCLLLGHNAYLWLGKRIVPDTDILALLPVQERDPMLQQSFTPYGRSGAAARGGAGRRG
jgi:predicted exporter